MCPGVTYVVQSGKPPSVNLSIDPLVPHRSISEYHLPRRYVPSESGGYTREFLENSIHVTSKRIGTLLRVSVSKEIFRDLTMAGLDVLLRLKWQNTRLPLSSCLIMLSILPLKSARPGNGCWTRIKTFNTCRKRSGLQQRRWPACSVLTAWPQIHHRPYLNER